MKKEMTFNDLLEMKLKALYDVENQILKALPKVIKGVKNSQLESALSEHLEMTKNHVERLEKVFELVESKPKRITVEAIRGMIDDTNWVMKNVQPEPVLDAALIASAQYVEHYEIAGYGTAITWAKHLGLDEAADILGQTLEEEKAFDQELSALATAEVNVEAMT